MSQMSALKKASPLLLIALTFVFMGTATGFELTGTIETNLIDSWADSKSSYTCNAMTSYFIPKCTKPIDVELGGSTTSEVQWSVSNSAIASTDNRKQVLGDVETNLNASYGIAVAEAKTEAIKELNNGSSESATVSETSDIVLDWYSEIQRNTINQRNRELLKVNETIKEVEATSGLSYSDVYRVEEAVEGGFSYNSPDDLRLQESNKTLYNGEEIPQYILQAKIVVNRDNYDSNDGCAEGPAETIVKWANITPNPSTIEYESYDSGCDTKKTEQLRVLDPNGNTTKMVENVEYSNTLNNIKTTKDRAMGNQNQIVSDIFSTYSAGDVNVSDSLGPLETIKTASTSYNSTGFYDYATVNAEAMGLATNETYAFTVEWNNSDMDQVNSDEGQLFMTEDAFNGSIEVNKTYDASSETVWFTRTTDAGNIENVQLDGTFTVTEMIDKNSGDSVNSTSVQSIEVYDSNVTDLKNQMDQLRDQLDSYETTSMGAGGSFGDIFGGLSNSMLFVIAGLSAVIIGVVIS